MTLPDVDRPVDSLECSRVGDVDPPHSCARVLFRPRGVTEPSFFVNTTVVTAARGSHATVSVGSRSVAGRVRVCVGMPHTARPCVA